jgi:hypothetical protein
MHYIDEDQNPDEETQAGSAASDATNADSDEEGMEDQPNSDEGGSGTGENDVEPETQTKAFNEVINAEMAQVEDSDVDESFKTSVLDELKGIFGELHLAKGQLIYIVVVLALVGSLIAGSFVFLFRFLGDDVGNVVAEKPKQEADSGPGFWQKLRDKIPDIGFGGEKNNEDSQDSDGDKPGSNPDRNQETSVVTEVGTDEARPLVDAVNSIEGLDRALIPFVPNIYIVLNALNEQENNQDLLAYYVRTFRQVRNIFNTDLFALLNNANDRKATFDQYLLDFKGYNAEVLLAYEDLRQEVEKLTETLTRIENLEQEIETNYINQAEALNSSILRAELVRFQELAKRRVVIRSELKAREQILNRYEDALPLISQKILAVEANKDAFIKGVKVTEFRQIDLDLVISE